VKKGYACKCGWTLGRGRLTRKQYAREKELHSKTCEHLRDELKLSGKNVNAEESNG
jgi:hypothetical protein